MKSLIQKTAAIISLLGLTTGGALAFSESGVVLEHDGGRPIAGAFLIATWRGRVPNPIVGGSSSCYGFAIARTDSEGRFTLSGTFPPSAVATVDKQVAIRAFASGYEEHWPRVKGSGRYEMRSPQALALERLRVMTRVLPLDCVRANEEKQLVPLLQAMNDEAQAIAKAPKELQLASEIRNTLARYSLGEEEFLRKLKSGELDK